jgi:5'-deoxynucleotidase YfbR-like HD superfamily hydrolase
VLFQINLVSKSLHSQSFDMCKSVELLEGCREFQKELKKNSLERAISAATELANDLQVESEFQGAKRVRNVKRHFQYEAHDQPVMTPENTFEIEILTCYSILL